MDRKYIFTVFLFGIFQGSFGSTANPDGMSKASTPVVQITVSRAEDDSSRLIPIIDIRGASKIQIRNRHCMEQKTDYCRIKSNYFIVNETDKADSAQCWRQLNQQGGSCKSNPGLLHVTAGQNIYLELERGGNWMNITIKLLTCIQPGHILMIDNRPADQQNYKWTVQNNGIKRIVVKIKNSTSLNWMTIRNSTHNSDMITITCRKKIVIQKKIPSEDSKTGIIIGVVSTVAVVIIILAGVVSYILLKRKRSRKRSGRTHIESAVSNGLNDTRSAYEDTPTYEGDYNILHQRIRRPVNNDIYEESDFADPQLSKSTLKEQCMAHDSTEDSCHERSDTCSDETQEDTTLLKENH